METIEILRLTNIILSILGFSVWMCFLIHYKEPGAFAPITWLINLVAFNIYRFITVDTLESIKITNTWSAWLHIHALLLLIGAAYIYRNKKLWTFTK